MRSSRCGALRVWTRRRAASGRPGLTWRRGGRWRVGSLLALAALLLGAWPAAAQPARRLAFEVTVVHVSQSAGEIDPRARKVDRLLGKRLRYQSLRVLETSRRKVALNQIESVALPSGGPFRFRPLDLGEQGVLVAVEAEAMPQGDFRVPPGKPLILGGRSYQDGQIVVILEPHY